MPHRKVRCGIKFFFTQFFFTPGANFGPNCATRAVPCRQSPTDLCLTDLDRILAEEQDPGAHHYLVLGTVPIKE